MSDRVAVFGIRYDNPPRIIWSRVAGIVGLPEPNAEESRLSALRTHLWSSQYIDELEDLGAGRLAASNADWLAADRSELK